MTQLKVTHPAQLSRREFLSAASAISILALVQWPQGAMAAGFDVDAFIALSESQLGQSNLSKDVATAMLKAYAATGKEDALAALAGGKKDPDLANSIVAAWYTGESPDADALQVLDYSDALIWQAMDYTKPMAVCGGDMGYWADPPEV
jgi:acetoin utilization deacetylase AcuC-like enzyme